jgi:hypothetical protein
MNHETSRPIVWLIVYGNLLVVAASFLTTGDAPFRAAAVVVIGMALARIAEYSGREADRKEKEQKP